MHMASRQGLSWAGSGGYSLDYSRVAPRDGDRMRHPPTHTLPRLATVSRLREKRQEHRALRLSLRLFARGRPELLALASLGVVAIALLGGCSLSGENGDATRSGQGSDDPSANRNGRDNVIVIQVDDARDDEINGGTMPNTVARIGRAGVRFSRYYATTPACCPSRTSLLTGRYTHNHRVLTNALKGGGYRAFRSHPAFESNLAPWLQRAGYRTVHIGKFINWYGEGDPREVPPGWDVWETTVGENEADPYYSYQLNVDGTIRRGFQQNAGCPANDATRACHYITDQITARGLAAIETAGGRPFYLQLDYTAPHGDLVAPEGPEPPARHSQRFREFQIKRAPSFNERDLSDKPTFVRRLPLMNRNRLGRLTKRERNRLRALRAVDDGVGQLLDSLAESGLAKRTWVFFVSDNGYLLGEHRFEASKFVAYEPATRLPLLVRGPAARAGGESSELVGNIDLAPTILRIADATGGHEVDGRSLLPFLEDPSRRSRRPLLLEAFNPSDVTAARNAPLPATEARAGPLSYTGIVTPRYKLIRYRDYQIELYDLARDPDELHSLDNSPAYNGVRRYLRRALTTREDCVGRACSLPLQTAPPRPSLHTTRG